MVLKLINLLMFALMVTMNYLANALPINNKTTGQLSAQYDNLFVPAGITFSIWGVIYLFLLAWVILQFRASNRALIQSLGWAFALSCLLNALWIVLWHYEHVFFSVVIMLALLATLIFINYQLISHRNTFSKAAFGIYLGWICIAAIANITALLVKINWGAWGISHQTWTIIMIISGLLITVLAMIRLGNPFMGIAVLWAFTGIVIKRTGGDFPAIVSVAYIAIAAIFLATVYAFIHSGIFSYLHNPDK